MSDKLSYLDRAWIEAHPFEGDALRQVVLPTLVLTVGLPLSGKSTWARQQDCPVVSPDAIRLAVHGQRFLAEAEDYVWLVARHMVTALFLAGHKRVIVDATNNSRDRREWWRSKRWQLVYRNFEATAEECKRRALERGDEEIVPVIERMSAAREPLSDYEQEQTESAQGGDHAD